MRSPTALPSLNRAAAWWAIPDQVRLAANHDIPSMTTLIPTDYVAWLAELKATIRTERLKAGLAVNLELVLPYWGSLQKTESKAR